MIKNYPFKLTAPHNGLNAPEFMACEVEFLEIMGWLCKAKGYKRLLEIGTYKGQSTWYFNELAKEMDGQVVTVDPSPQEQVTLSHVQYVGMTSKEYIHSVMAGRFDFIFIDGDHTREGCREDFFSSRPLLTDKGAIAIHDTVYMPGVKEALLDIKKKYPDGWIDLAVGKGLSIYTI